MRIASLIPAARTPGLAPGDVVSGRYRIESFLAGGGMGDIYRALDLDLDVPLALKTIRPEIASNRSALRRFKQEVLLARSVAHPNVCRIFDLGRDASIGVSFLTMELLPGETLASRIGARGALPAGVALPLVRQMADALDAAHGAGIIHRDFKSSNVMLVPSDHGERAVITDFGLALSHLDRNDGDGVDWHIDSAASDATSETIAAEPRAPGERRIVGTPAYMSPEQVAGRPLSPATDLYALGVVLFEMSTGQRPFHASSPLETARAHITTEPPRPSTLAEMEDSWEQTVLRLLSKRPSERFATAHDAVLALEGHLPRQETVRHSLRAERDAFVGRDHELTALSTHLEECAGPHRRCVLTLLGPGGTGKTRLAERYGWSSLARWPGGVWFCDLAEARSVDGIAQAVAASLQVRLGKEDPIVQLGHAIAARRKCLVILDNFEQVVEYAEATLGRWLARATETSFLVTTRERLGLPEEVLHELEPLDPETHGVELFELRARGHRPAFALDASNRQHVEEIVRRLDGLPLAIELAASRLRMLSLQQLRDRLEDRFRILTGGKRGRHATLRATLDWSWELLQPWEQSAVMQAAIFEGGFSLEAAESVIDLAAHEDAPSVLDVIQSLVDKSWLRAQVTLERARFEMYATVQEYALAKLHARPAPATAHSHLIPGSPSEIQARHAIHYATLGTEAALDMLERHGGIARRAALELELDNLVLACQHGIEHRDAETTSNTYLAAAAVLELHGPFATSVRLGRSVLASLDDPPRRGNVLIALGSAERSCGQVEAAREHWDTAVSICREVGARSAEGIALGHLGSLHRNEGRVDEAYAHYETALTIHRETGDQSLEASALGNLGSLHFEQGRASEARLHNEAALAMHREVGNRRGEGVVLGNLGTLHKDQGRLDEARKHYEAALAIHRELRNRLSEATVLGNLGSLHWEQGRLDVTRQHFEGALVILRELGNRMVEGTVLGNLGILHWEQGRLAEARQHYELALSILREVRNRRGEGIVLGTLGALHHELKRTEVAREHYEAALEIHREVGNRVFEGIVLGNLGALHREQGRTDEARRCVHDSIAVFRALDNQLELGHALCQLSKHEHQQDNAAAARSAFAEADAIASALRCAPGSKLACEIEEVRQLLGSEAG